MKYLYTPCGTQFQVSDEDEIFIVGFNWSLSGWGYIWCRSGIYRNRHLHKIIAERMGIDFSNQIDHKDGNKLNNQRNNLRPANKSQNNMNRKVHSNNTSGCTGVYQHGDKWVASIKLKERLLYLGLFDNYEEARRIREEAEIKYFGEFRREKNDRF